MQTKAKTLGRKVGGSASGRRSFRIDLHTTFYQRYRRRSSGGRQKGEHKSSPSSAIGLPSSQRDRRHVKIKTRSYATKKNIPFLVLLLIRMQQTFEVYPFLSPRVHTTFLLLALSNTNTRTPQQHSFNAADWSTQRGTGDRNSSAITAVDETFTLRGNVYTLPLCKAIATTKAAHNSPTANRSNAKGASATVS